VNITFDPGNTIVYLHKEAAHVGIPDGIEFEIVGANDGVLRLVALGDGGNLESGERILVYLARSRLTVPQSRPPRDCTCPWCGGQLVVERGGIPPVSYGV
jgi:hypothetical protein